MSKTKYMKNILISNNEIALTISSKFSVVNRIFTLVYLILIPGCTFNYTTEKIQKHRDDVIDVSDRIIDINTNIIYGNSALYILDDYLIVLEKFQNSGKAIHLFDKATFKHIASTGVIGSGPGEIVRPGPIITDYKKNVFWVPDAGKKLLYKFPLDSVLRNPDFLPGVKEKMDYIILNAAALGDSIIIGMAAYPTTGASPSFKLSKINLIKNEYELFGYINPEVREDRSEARFTVSHKHEVCITCYSESDLMTICDLDGNLKYNIYGPGWFDTNKDKKSYFFQVNTFSDKIIASYIGSDKIIVRGGLERGAAPNRFLIFDMEGNYIKTIITKFEFEQFCIDEENKRIIAYFDGREKSLGYIDISFLFQ